MNAPLTKKLFAKIKSLATSGATAYRISKDTGLSYATVDDIIKNPDRIWHHSFNQIGKLEAFYTKNRKAIKSTSGEARSWDDITPEMFKDAQHTLNIGKKLDYVVAEDISNFTGISVPQIYRLHRGQSKLKNAFPRTVSKLYAYDKHNRGAYHQAKLRRTRTIRQIKISAERRIRAIKNSPFTKGNSKKK